MSLYAYVDCNCFRENRATPPPFAPELVGYGQDGFGLLQSDASEELLDLFMDWQDTACVHPRMHIAEWNAAWSYLERFRDALIDYGIEHFPALVQHLFRSENDSGALAVEAARTMIPDLAHFARIYRGTGAILIDEQGRGHAKENSWTSTQGEVAILGPDGLKFLDGRRTREVSYGSYGKVHRWLEQTSCKKRTSLTLFHTNRAAQVYIGDIANEYGRRLVEYRDVTTGKRHRSFISFTRPAPHNAPPARELIPQFRVEPRTISADEFDYLTVDFRELLEASVATGNPVHWTP